MTIYDDLLASGKFTPEMIASWTHQTGKPVQVTFAVTLTDEQVTVYRNILRNILDPENIARQTDFDAAQVEMKLQFASVISDLSTHIDSITPTTQADFNTRVWAFTKLSARVLRFILRILRFLVFS